MKNSPRKKKLSTVLCLVCLRNVAWRSCFAGTSLRSGPSRASKMARGLVTQSQACFCNPSGARRASSTSRTECSTVRLKDASVTDADRPRADSIWHEETFRQILRPIGDDAQFTKMRARAVGRRGLRRDRRSMPRARGPRRSQSGSAGARGPDVDSWASQSTEE